MNGYACFGRGLRSLTTDDAQLTSRPACFSALPHPLAQRREALICQSFRPCKALLSCPREDKCLRALLAEAGFGPELLPRLLLHLMASVAIRLGFILARVALAPRLRSFAQLLLPGAEGILDGFLRPLRAILLSSTAPSALCSLQAVCVSALSAQQQREAHRKEMFLSFGRSSKKPSPALRATLAWQAGSGHTHSTS